MKETKKWWESKTIIGSIMAALGAVIALLGNFGIDVPFTAEAIEPVIAGVLSTIGFIFTVVGRFTAKKDIE